MVSMTLFLLLANTLAWYLFAVLYGIITALTHHSFIRSRKIVLLLLLLFPWLILLRRLRRPAQRMKRQNLRRYRLLMRGCILGGWALILIGIVVHHTTLGLLGDLIELWTGVFYHMTSNQHDQDDDHGHGHDDPQPDDPSPTPTGDAAERWLISQQSVSSPR